MLAVHTADQVWERLNKYRATLIREFGPSGLIDFAFAGDTPRIKLLVSGVPLAPTGQGSVWKVDDWTGDKAFDSIRTDLEGSTPSVVTAGRPNMLGTVHAMKASEAISCAIRVIGEKSTSVDDVMRCNGIYYYRYYSLT